MQGRLHIEGFIIVISTTHGDESSRGIGADHRKKIGEPRSAEPADDIPPFHAHMARVLSRPRQGLNLRQSVFAWLLYCSADGESPVFEDHSRVIDVIVIDRKSLKRRQFRVSKCRGEIPATKQLL